MSAERSTTRLVHTGSTTTVALLAAVIIGFGMLATVGQAAPRAATSGALDWGVRASFRNYIVGPIAHGSIQLSNGASQNGDGTFRFPFSSGSHDSATGTTTAAFGGTVRFEGHDQGSGPLLLMTLSNVRIELNGATGTLYADIVSKSLDSGEEVPYIGVAFASLSGATASTAGDSVSWSAVAANLTATGSPAFAGFYAAGESVDPVSFSLGLAPEATATSTATSTQTTTATTTASSTASTASATASTTTQPAITAIPVESVIDPADLDPAVAPVSSLAESGQVLQLVDNSGAIRLTAQYFDPDGGSAAVLLARYSDGWTPGPGLAFVSGETVYDVHVTPSATTSPAATLRVTFTGLEPGKPLRWWDGNSWEPLVSDTGEAAVASAGGTAIVVFGQSSTPPLRGLSGTPVTTVSPATATPTPSPSPSPSPSATPTTPATTTTTSPVATTTTAVTQPTGTATQPTPLPPNTGAGPDGSAAAGQWQMLALVAAAVLIGGGLALSLRRGRRSR